MSPSIKDISVANNESNTLFPSVNNICIKGSLSICAILTISAKIIVYTFLRSYPVYYFGPCSLCYWCYKIMKSKDRAWENHQLIGVHILPLVKQDSTSRSEREDKPISSASSCAPYKTSMNSQHSLLVISFVCIFNYVNTNFIYILTWMESKKKKWPP